MSRDCSWKGPPAPHQETSVSTTRPLHVPPSWKVTVSPWPWASPRGVEKGGLRGAGGAVLTLKSIRSGEGTQADLGGSSSHGQAAGFHTGRGHGGRGA